MRFERRVSSAHVDTLANVFGDVNPLHIDTAAARAAGFARPIAQGAVLVCFLSEIIGRRLGGIAPIFCGLDIAFERPFYADDLLAFELEPRHRSAALAATAYAFTVTRAGERVARGEFLVKDGAAAAGAASAGASTASR
ncbi:MAG TPA: MaoC/PaaZ C-terminal domain-containing protein [Candidatus Limnocylindria bacterium]|nr:MaoC/PaaZ C-terminal domain-containing protein [Candidatus Limnocylindria bacterium]